MACGEAALRTLFDELLQLDGGNVASMEPRPTSSGALPTAGSNPTRLFDVLMLLQLPRGYGVATGEASSQEEEAGQE